MGEVIKPSSLLIPLDFPKMLLLGPGPSNCPPRVLAAGSLPLLGHMNPEFIRIMDEVKLGLQYLFQTRNRVTLAVSGTGHCAMETVIFNVLEPTDTILVAVNGVWGQRVAALCKRNGITVKTISKPPGQSFTLSEIEHGLQKYKPDALFICHSESSTGVMQPLENVGSTCHRHNCLLLVDAVASLGAVPIQTDQLEIDVIYSGTQKVLSAPPGVSLISFSERAMSKVASRKTEVRSFYLDILHLANYWGCDGQPRRYHHTGPVTCIYQLREALSLLVEEGLEGIFERHKNCANMLYKGLSSLGLSLFVADKEIRLPTVTAVTVPQGIHWKNVVNYCMEKYKLEISGGLGPTAGRVWRIGLMGYNCNPHNVSYLLRVLSEAIDKHRNILALSKL